MDIFILALVFVLCITFVTTFSIINGRAELRLFVSFLKRVFRKIRSTKEERWLNDELISSSAAVQMELLKCSLSIDNLPMMVYTVNQSCEITNANDLFCRTLGYERVSIIGKRVNDFLSEESLSHIKDHEWDEFSIDDPVVENKWKFITSDSKKLIFEIHKSRPVLLSEPEIYSTIILIDITDITNSHEKIRECEILSKFIFDNIGDTILTVSEDGTILTANSYSLIMFGYTEKQLIGKPLSYLITNSAFSSFDIDNISHVSIRDSSMSTNGDLFYGRKRGSDKIPVSIAVKNVATQGVDHKVVIIRDIENIVKEKINLLHERETAKKESISKSEFLSNMSHELRTPLNSILGFSQLLLSSENGTLNSDQVKCIEHMYSGGKHLLSIIEDVLEFSKIEAGKIAICRAPEEIDRFLYDVIESLKPIADEQKICLVYRSTNNPQNILIDTVRIKQVVANLVSNGIKYNRVGGKVDVSWLIDKNHNLRIMVDDTGIGIEADMISRLFLPFERLGKEESDIKGTGIGLSYTKRLVELMNGTIEVVSEKDHGSRFTVTIPIKMSNDSHNSTTAPSKELNISDKTILYIEDNIANQKVVSMSLNGKVKSLVVCSDGISGIKKCFEIEPNIILMDIHMPGMSGIEAMEVIKSDPRSKHIPVIALSAHAEQNVVLDCLKLGFDDYLTKPINFDAFFSTLDKY